MEEISLYKLWNMWGLSYNSIIMYYATDGESTKRVADYNETAMTPCCMHALFIFMIMNNVMHSVCSVCVW